MRRFLVPVLAALGLAFSTVVITSAPSSAAYTTVVSAVDTSTTGHAKGTITTDAPFVEVGLRWGDLSYGSWNTEVQTVSSGVAEFDVTTWGATTAYVVVRACADADAWTCDAAITSELFTASDSVPVVTWPEDRTVGVDDEFTITVDDGGAGGNLYAVWSGRHWNSENTPLPDQGEVTLPLASDGTDEVVVMRCIYGVGSFCRTLTTHAIQVNRRLESQIAYDDLSLGAVNTTTTSLNPLIKVYESLPTGASITFDWHIADSLDGQPVPGLSGQITGITLDGNGEFRPGVDASALTTNRRHFLRGSLSYSDPDFGIVAGQIGQVEFDVDTVAPAVKAITFSDSIIYPWADTYQDYVNVKATWSGGGTARIQTEVYDSADALVKTFAEGQLYSGSIVQWHGRIDGGVAPAGIYTLRTTVVDDAGNASAPADHHVEVVRERMKRLSMSKTVSAAGSLRDAYVGKCSTLAKPAARGWAGSLGLYTNTRCSKSLEASLVMTQHSLRLPDAIVYEDFKVIAYGGAAKSAPRSLAYIGYINTKDELVSDVRMSPGVGNHAGASRDGKSFVWPNRRLYWMVYTAQGARYDLKSFTVKLTYWGLIPE